MAIYYFGCACDIMDSKSGSAYFIVKHLSTLGYYGMNVSIRNWFIKKLKHKLGD